LDFGEGVHRVQTFRALTTGRAETLRAIERAILPDPAWRASRRCDWHFSRPNSHLTIREYFISASQNLPRQPPVSLFEELDDLQLLFGRSFEEFFVWPAPGSVDTHLSYPKVASLEAKGVN
jgi:hypothetical protein